ncbi:MAG: beta-mannanase [Kiritimatiellae bacterium]|nr:beta-mannanase [Kiritimatiellia bacterium]
MSAAIGIGMRPFPGTRFSVGCNYWASHAGMMMWRRWDAERVARDLDSLSENGLSVLRVFPLWPDFQPLTAQYGGGGQFRAWAQNDGPLQNPECVAPEMVRRFRDFCDMAEARGLRLVVGILTGWMSGRLFVPPAIERRELLTDPVARMWEVRFVRRFIRETRDRPAIVAWDVGNECNCMGRASREEAWTWLHEITAAIRVEDPSRPVVGGMHSLGSDARAAWNLRDHGELVDLLTTHPYPLWTPHMNHEPFDTLRNGVHAAAQSLLYAGVSGRPCFPEEAGDMGRNVCSEARAAGSVRAALFTSWACGLRAFLWWCAFDQGHLDFPPYAWTALEGELGLFDKDFRTKPVLAEMRDFATFLKGFPFAELPPRRVDAVCLASENEDAVAASLGAFALARQAGFDLSFAGAEGEWPESDFYILPSGEGYDTYSVTAWRRVLDKVAGGATLLVTKGGKMALADFRAATGNEIDFSAQDTPSDVGFELAAHPGRTICARSPSTVRIVPRESRVLGATADGDAMMTVADYGKGRVVFVNAPIEREAFLRGGAFSGEDPNPLYLAYREAAKLAGVRRVVEKGDCPCVGITEHPAEEGSTVIVAVNHEPRAVECPVSICGRIGRVWLGAPVDGALALPPHGIAVFEVAEIFPNRKTET